MEGNDKGAMRIGVFLGWMEIQVDINLDLALTNATISTFEFKGLFTG